MKRSLKVTVCIAISLILALGVIFIVKGAFSDGDETDDRSSTEALSGRNRYNFLVVGKDTASGLGDVMMLVSYDAGEECVNVLQLPRDTYAEYAKTSYRKLNGALAMLGGERALCDFLSQALCVPIDRYVTLELDALEELVDGLGGVEVDVPFDMDYEDPAQDLSIHIKKGKNLLDGKAAREFVRYRSGYLRGDIGRIDAQKIFLASLARKVKNELTPAELSLLVLRMLDEVRTNATVTDAAELLGAVGSVDEKNIRFITLAGEDAVATQSGASYYVISRPATIELLGRYFGGYGDSESFDSLHLFLNESYSEFRRIYESYAPYSVYTADDILGGGLDIAQK